VRMFLPRRTRDAEQVPSAKDGGTKAGRFVLGEVKCRRELRLRHRVAATMVRRDADAAAARGRGRTTYGGVVLV